MAKKNLQKPRILAVDDSLVMRRAMSKILNSIYDVVEAKNGEDAWKILLNDSSIQIVFSDLDMPVLDGFALLERIRGSNNPRLKETPVIIITGKNDNDKNKQQALNKGANDFIAKPFDSIQLQARAKAHVTFKQTSTKLSEVSDKLERQATIDETTGLGSQHYFSKVGDETLSYAIRHNGQFIVARLEIDNFNNLFIKYGKKIMDSMLQSIGKKLPPLVRPDDTLARISVSKFALILKETTMDETILLANRIHKEIQSMSFTLPETGERIKLTISTGLYEAEINNKLSFSDIISKADDCLAKAISAGGDRIVSHSTRNIKYKNKQAEDNYILELLEKLKENKPHELLPQIDSILHHLTPLLKFLADNAEDKLQATLHKINKNIRIKKR